MAVGGDWRELTNEQTGQSWCKPWHRHLLLKLGACTTRTTSAWRISYRTDHGHRTLHGQITGTALIGLDIFMHVGEVTNNIWIYLYENVYTVAAFVVAKTFVRIGEKIWPKIQGRWNLYVWLLWTVAVCYVFLDCIEYLTHRYWNLGIRWYLSSSHLWYTHCHTLITLSVTLHSSLISTWNIQYSAYIGVYVVEVSDSCNSYSIRWELGWVSHAIVAMLFCLFILLEIFQSRIFIN